MYIQISIAWHTYITFHDIPSHYITLHYITLHYITLYSTTLHYVYAYMQSYNCMSKIQISHHIKWPSALVVVSRRPRCAWDRSSCSRSGLTSSSNALRQALARSWQKRWKSNKKLVLHKWLAVLCASLEINLSSEKDHWRIVSTESKRLHNTLEKADDITSYYLFKNTAIYFSNISTVWCIV